MPTSERQFILYEALRKGADIDQLYHLTYIKPWFLQQMQELVELEERDLALQGPTLPNDLLATAKQDGFADRYLAMLLDLPEAEHPPSTHRTGRCRRLGSRPGQRCRECRLLFFDLQCARSDQRSATVRK